MYEQLALWEREPWCAISRAMLLENEDEDLDDDIIAETGLGER